LDGEGGETVMPVEPLVVQLVVGEPGERDGKDKDKGRKGALFGVRR